MTGAKVLRIYEAYGPGVVSLSSLPPSKRPISSTGSSVPLSALYYGHGKQYRVCQELLAVYLQSPQQGTLWPEPQLVAKLSAYKKRIGPQNGIHAYHNLRAAVAANYHPAHQNDHPGKQAVYAIVRPEGKVAVGEYGWVAESATIVRIFLLPESYLRFARDLYDRYRVPVEPLPRSLREFRPDEPVDSLNKGVPVFGCWNRRYGPESGAKIWWCPYFHAAAKWQIVLPRAVRRPANIAVWDPVMAAWGEARQAALRRMTAQDWGRIGGLARARAFRRGEVAVSGAAVARATVCPRCGKCLPSARQAWRHCRTGKAGRPKKNL